TAALWLLLFRDGSGGGEGERERGRGVSEPVAALVEELTVEERVDQVLLLGFEGTDATAPFFDQVGSRQLGGALIAARNWLDADQGTLLAGELRAVGLAGGRIPPLIVASQEGGRYRSLAGLPPEQTELEIGDAGSIPGTEAWAADAAGALRAAGIDLNLFPVADVATLDSPIADRAFSDDPAIAAQMTAAAVRGCRAGGTACAALHFPGLGAASQDTNRGPATVSLDAASLADRDLLAFRAAFAERVPAVVVSLAFYAAYDPVTPGALAEAVATDLLRDQLRYDGVAITDDLGAGAVRSGHEVREAAVLALGAGTDLVQVSSPADQAGVREALIEAVANGRLAEGRLAEAAGRVLELKRAQGLLRLP
ncbi:MAG: glycoside hydrolase family 3 N-terminal domain-containing protein, partial [Solirubrobacterales bacterium]